MQPTPLDPQYVVCETIYAIALHIRPGVFQPCGKQDSLTLCNKAAAWDLKIGTVGGDGNWCSSCFNEYDKVVNRGKMLLEEALGASRVINLKGHRSGGPLDYFSVEVPIFRSTQG